MRAACLEVRKHGGIRKTARKYQLPYHTLRGRAKGRLPHAVAHQDSQRLSVNQEDVLKDWILFQGSLGDAPSHQQIKELAQRILTERGDDQKIGKRWVRHFITRHPILKTQRPRRIDSARIKAATAEVIRPWFNYLCIPAVQAIPPEYRWNMDEAGLMEGLGSNGYIVGNSRRRAITAKKPDSRTWITFVECISATGVYLPPVVIYKGKTVQQQWYPKALGSYKDWHFATSEKGWTNDEIGLEWLVKKFLPLTTPSDPEQRRLLILDGHHSHTTHEFMWQCYRNKVQVLYLPAHCSHVLQPLDLAIFSSLKNRYRDLLNNRQSEGLEESSVIGKRLFLECYRLARVEALSERNIRSGWKAGGLWPVNMSKPLMSRHLLSNNDGFGQNNGPDIIQQPLTAKGATLEDYGHVVHNISTPKKARELRAHLRPTGEATPTERLLFRKLEKAFDQRDYTIAIQTREIEMLKATIERMKPTKRKKVIPEPNSVFARIEEIHEAQVEAGRFDSEDSEEEEEEELETENERVEDCIVAEG